MKKFVFLCIFFSLALFKSVALDINNLDEVKITLKTEQISVEKLFAMAVANECSNMEVFEYIFKKLDDVKRYKSSLTAIIGYIVNGIDSETIRTKPKDIPIISEISIKKLDFILDSGIDKDTASTYLGIVMSNYFYKWSMLKFHYDKYIPECEKFYIFTIDKLIKLGAKNDFSSTLITLCKGKHNNYVPTIDERIKWLDFIIKYGGNINTIDEKGNSLIRIIMTWPDDMSGNEWDANSRINLCEVLIKAGTDVNTIDKEDNSLLMFVVTKPANMRNYEWGYYSGARIKLCELLIKAGANVNYKNSKGETALTRTEDESVAKLLLRNGAKLK